MKKIIFVMNDHAEVGKTCTSAALNCYLKAQGVNAIYIAAIGNLDDPDAVNAASYDTVWNVIEDNDINLLFGWAEQHDVVLCDVESGNSAALIDLYEKEDLDVVLSEMNIDLTIVTPEVEEGECHEEILRLSDIFSDNADYIVPRIPLDEFRSSLEAWEDSDASNTMDYLGAAVLEMPRVTDAMQELLEDNGWTVCNAMEHIYNLPEEFTGSFVSWKKDFDRQMEEGVDYILPSASRRAFKIAVGQ